MRLFKNTKKRCLIVFLINWVFWGGYFTLLWSKQLITTSKGLVAGGTGTWGDGAAHLTYMSGFAFRKNPLINHPLFWGKRFSYPFVADMIGGYLVKLGLSLTTAYVLWGLVLSMLLVVMVFWLFQAWFKSVWGALLGAALFFWSGGLGWWWFLKDVINDGLVKTIMMLPREYTHMEDRGIYWINTISAEFLPQRAFLLGMSVGIGVLLLLTKARSATKKRRWWFVKAGWLTGLLPIIHPHTLIVISVVSIWWWLDEFIYLKSKKEILDWLWYLVPSGLLGMVLLWIFVLPAIDTTFIKFWPGWMANIKARGGNFWWLWVNNWGVFWILAIGGFLAASKKIKRLVIGFVFLWMVANLFLFQPWAWDNSKIFTWVYLVFAGIAGWFLEQLWQRKELLGKIIVVGLFVIATLAGMLDTIRVLQWQNTSLEFIDQEGLMLAELVKQKTDPEAIFLTGDQHNHWVPVLTGRQILMGYQGWLWSYGIDYGQRDKDVKAMYAGEKKATRLFKNYGVDYAVIGPYEKMRFAVNELWFEENFPLALETQNTRVYQIEDL